MAKTLLQRITESLAKEGLKPRSNAARDWLRSKVKELKPSAQTLMNDRKRLRDSSIIGKMYFYFYDPKTKEKMKYYDRFPLVIPIENYKDGFLGLNLHYIHPKQRIILLDKLSATASNKSFDENTKLRISYAYLAAAAKAFEANPCIKRYLFSHVQSRFLEITANEWDIAVMLPVESFVGATTSKVYSDSRKKF
tara:strand:+ start:1540 stop:2121 length:582 start_codon:yes stop_codon:yes gene_type:complete